MDAKEIRSKMTLDEYTNPEFSRQVAAEQAAAMMRNLALLTCRTNFSVAMSDVEEIERARESVVEAVDRHFEMIREVMAERRANLERYQDIRLVSLGEDCFSRTLATQWGLKKCAKLGELSHPFDLSVHPLPRLAGLINCDFEGYLKLEDLKFYQDRKICRNDALNISFNHELGEKYAENDFALLREIYQRRVNNFRKLLTEDGKVVFLLRLLRPRPNARFHLRNLADALRQRCRSSEILLICVNTTGEPVGANANAGNRNGDDLIEIVDAPYPMENYVWFAPKQCLSPEGHEFEKTLVAAIKAIIDRRLG